MVKKQESTLNSADVQTSERRVMDTDKFFNLLFKEVGQSPELQKYYKILCEDNLREFRKAYFCQRLDYILRSLDKIKLQKGSDSIQVWDCGCGYGSTLIFLAINNIPSFGTTIGKHYESGMPKRLKYWSKYGDMGLFKVMYQALPDNAPPDESCDAIIIQDTLHHMEPVDDILKALHGVLKKNGKLIIIEPNGSNLFHRTTQYLRRGNNRVQEIYDENLNKKMLYGDENYRCLKKWKKLLNQNNFIIDEEPEYIKFFFPFFYNGKNTTELIQKEQLISKKSSFLRKYFFFGMNFTASKL